MKKIKEKIIYLYWINRMKKMINNYRKDYEKC